MNGRFRHSVSTILLIIALFSISLAPAFQSASVQAQGMPPTPYEYGLMSKIAYDLEDDDNFVELLTHDIAATVNAAGLTWPSAPSWDFYSFSSGNGKNDAEGYFGVAFINRSTQQVVIAHRGTDVRRKLESIIPSLGDLKSDIQIFFGKVPSQANSAKSFVQGVRSKLNADGYGSYTISHTGHSLGAVLAEIMTAQYAGNRAVTFDSPGSKPILPSGSYPVVTYQGAPNAVNTAKAHVGEMILVVPDWEDLRAKHLTWKTIGSVMFRLVIQDLWGAWEAIGYKPYTYEAHNLTGILRNFDPISGQPRADSLTGIESWWPVGVSAGYSNFLFPKKASGTPLDSLHARLADAATGEAFTTIIGTYAFQKGTHLDLVFVIDTTGSMGDDIAAVKEAAVNVVDEVARQAESYRIGLVLYRDQGDIYVTNSALGFTSDPDAVVAAITAISIGGGGDFAESVYAGINTALDYPWQPGANKAIILMGDAPPKNPDPTTGLTQQDIYDKSFALDPVHVYPVAVGIDAGAISAFQDIADGTFGQLTQAYTAADVVAAIFEAIEGITDDPVVPPLLPSESAAVAAPSVPLCSDVGGTVNAVVRADVPAGAVDSGSVFCRVLVENAEYLDDTSAATIGNQELINKGIVQAVDVFGMNHGGYAVSDFASSVTVCLLGNGTMYYLDATTAPRRVMQLAASLQGSYTCASIPDAGTVVLAGVGPANPDVEVETPSTASSALTGCMVRTQRILNLRTEPGTDSEVISLVPYDVTLTAMQREGNWFYVDYLGVPGWLSADYVALVGDCQ